MNIKVLVLFLTISFLIVSCSKEVEREKNARKHIEFLKSKSLSDIKSQLKEEVKYIEKLIEESEFEFVYTSHFSSAEKIKVNKSVDEFNINYDNESIEKVFKWYYSHLCFEQNFREKSPNDLFENDIIEYKSEYKYNYPITGKDTIFEDFESNIDFEEIKYFHAGKQIKKGQIGLKKIDSIYTKVELDIPQSLNKIIIDKAQKKINYNNEIIEVERIKENTIAFKVPNSLNEKIIAVQALNSGGFRMSSNAYSSNPIFENDKNRWLILKELANIYRKVLSEGDEKFAKKYLEQITQNHFDARNDFSNFRDELKKIYADYKKIKEKDPFTESEVYHKVLKAGKNVLSNSRSSVQIDFSDNIQKVEVFISKEVKTINNTQYVKFEKLSTRDNLNPNIIYSCLSSNDGSKYGIIDKHGNKLIEAKYDKLIQLGNNYFLDDEKLFWYDENEKGLVRLPNDYVSYAGNIKPGYDIIEKKVGRRETLYGIVEAPGKKVIDFIYYKITKFDNLIIAEQENKVSFFDLNFKELPVKGITRINQVGNEISSNITFPLLFDAENSSNKVALLNKNLKQLTPYKYESIDPFYNINNYYIVTVRSKNKENNYLYGIINNKGQEVVPLIFLYINPSDDDADVLFYELNDKKESISIMQFIQKYRLKK